MKKMFLGLIIGVLLFSNVAFATFPDYLTVQGRLSKSDGEIVSGSTDMVFRICTSSTGCSVGTLVYEQYETLVLENGIFNVLLGPLGTDFTDDNNYYLHVYVGSEEQYLEPGVEITSSAFAYTAQGADDFEVRGDINITSDTTMINMPLNGELKIEGDNEDRGVTIHDSDVEAYGLFDGSPAPLFLNWNTKSPVNVGGDLNVTGHSTFYEHMRFPKSNTGVNLCANPTSSVCYNLHNLGGTFKVYRTGDGLTPATIFTINPDGDIYSKGGIKSDGTICDGAGNCMGGATGDYVLKTGDTMTGGLTIEQTGATLLIKNSDTKHQWEWYTGGSVGNNGLGLFDRTNSAYRLAITNDGKVGIGTTSPGSKLDVNGDLSVGGDLGFAGSGSYGLINFPKSSNDNIFFDMVSTGSNDMDLRLYLQDDYDGSEKFSIWGGSCDNGGCFQDTTNAVQLHEFNAAGNAWHKGDLSVDGTISGSGTGITGVDADKLDGKNSSEFALAGHSHNYAGSSTPGGVATNADKLDGKDSSDFMSREIEISASGPFENRLFTYTKDSDGIKGNYDGKVVGCNNDNSKIVSVNCWLTNYNSNYTSGDKYSNAEDGDMAKCYVYSDDTAWLGCTEVSTSAVDKFECKVAAIITCYKLV